MADKTIKAGKRTGNAPWKKIYGKDRGYTRRVDSAKERGQFTEPGTPGGAPKRETK